MQLPVDIMAVMTAATDIDEARKTPLSVSIYFDDSAPGDVQALVRQAFASSSVHARVSLIYLDGRPFIPFDGDDIAVIVAGLNEEVGKYAAELRSIGVPTMVVTSLPSLVTDIAEAAGTPLLQGDVLGPEPLSRDWVLVCEKASDTIRTKIQDTRLEQELKETLSDTDNQTIDCGRASKSRGLHARSTTPLLRMKHRVDSVASHARKEDSEEQRSASAEAFSEEVQEPIVLTDGLSSVLMQRMGAWVVEVVPEKRLAFALAFPFVRKPLALESVRTTSLQNAGVGLVMFIPGADMPVMTLNQAKMLLLIAAAYGEELGPARVKELAAVVGGAFACRTVARQLVSFVPALGWAIKAAIGYAGTQAMGMAAIEYFEGGPTVDKLAETLAQARNRVIQVAALRVAEKAQDSGSQMMSVAAGTVAKAVSGSFVRAKRSAGKSNVAQEEKLSAKDSSLEGAASGTRKSLLGAVFSKNRGTASDEEIPSGPTHVRIS